MWDWLDRRHIMHDKNPGISLYALISNATVYMCNVFRELNCNQKITVSGDEHLESRFNTALILQKKHLFVQKSWGITTSSKQTRSFCVRIEIKTLVILRMLFAYMSPESIRTHGCSRISRLFSVILNSLLWILSHVFYSSHSAYYVWLCSFLKLKVIP